MSQSGQQNAKAQPGDGAALPGAQSGAKVETPKPIRTLGSARIWALHLAVLALLFALGWVLPDYHHANFARIFVLATYAAGFNLAFGYGGLLSLGHALFFAAGLYGAGLPAIYWGVGGTAAFFLGIAAAGAMALLTGLLALRTRGVAFMIVTLMFAQAFHLTLLALTGITRGDEGLTLSGPARVFLGLDLTQGPTRYLLALALMSVVLLATLALVRGRQGQIIQAMRENEERSRMLGFDPFATRLLALVLSGLVSGAAGAAWGLLFGYVGAGFAAVQYSILPLLYVLLGGAGTVLGPLLGTILMFYLTDYASNVTDAYHILVGLVLILLVLFAPAGLLGWLRRRWRDLP